MSLLCKHKNITINRDVRSENERNKISIYYLITCTGSAADWWSVGIILFELITGIPPFNAEHPEVFILQFVVTWIIGGKALFIDSPLF